MLACGNAVEKSVDGGVVLDVWAKIGPDARDQGNNKNHDKKWPVFWFR
jgi:hypothetical protein